MQRIIASALRTMPMMAPMLGRCASGGGVVGDALLGPPANGGSEGGEGDVVTEGSRTEDRDCAPVPCPGGTTTEAGATAGTGGWVPCPVDIERAGE